MKRQEALAKILDGVRKFQAEVYPAQRKMFERPEEQAAAHGDVHHLRRFAGSA